VPHAAADGLPGPPFPPHVPPLRAGPVALYAQLAAILRDRITSGAWVRGSEIPTLDELVREFSVARVTARQAVQMLVEENLLSSQRGRRTLVTFLAPEQGALPLYSSTGLRTPDGSKYSIRVLAREEFGRLPRHFSVTNKVAERYMRIRKVDSQEGVPYAVSDNYVALDIFKRFPSNAERKVKLVRLVRTHSAPPLDSGTEHIRIAALGYEEAGLLQAPIGSPAALVTRVFVARDRVAYFGNFFYRADRFDMLRDISTMLAGPDRP